MVIDYAHYFCDICKQPYPERMEVEGVERDVLEWHRSIPGSSLHLDFYEVNSERIRHTLVLPLKDTGEHTICVGRQKEFEIFLKDVSVSRLHAKLRWANNKLFLSDCHSKFGTSILAQSSLPFEGPRKISFLVDKVYLTLQMVDAAKVCGERIGHFAYKGNPRDDARAVDDYISTLFDVPLPSPEAPSPKPEEEQPDIPISNFETGPLRPNLILGEVVEVASLPPAPAEPVRPQANPTGVDRSKKSSGKKSALPSGRKPRIHDATFNIDRLQPEDPSQDDLEEVGDPNDSDGTSLIRLDSELQRINRLLEGRGASLSSILEEEGQTDRPLNPGRVPDWEKENRPGSQQGLQSSLFDLKSPHLETNNFTASSGRKEPVRVVGSSLVFEEADSPSRAFNFD